MTYFDSLDFVWIAALTLQTMAAGLLGRWTLKRLMLFLFVAAMLWILATQVRSYLYHHPPGAPAYTVNVSPSPC